MVIKISRATYFRWKKAGILPPEGEYEVVGLKITRKSQSQSKDYHDSDEFHRFTDEALGMKSQFRSQSQKQSEVDENIKNILQDTYEMGKKSHTVSSEIQPGGTVAGSFFLCETEMELVTHVFNAFEKQYQNKSPDWVRMLQNLRGRLGI